LNEALLALYTADREERIDQPRMGTPEYTAMRARDRQRRLRAAAILSTLEAPEATDLYHAALLFQHGDESEDAWRAYELAREAAERGEERARWLTAAAYDRWLMYQGKPQKYGTNMCMMESGIVSGMSMSARPMQSGPPGMFRRSQSSTARPRRPLAATRRSQSILTMHPGG
jgi:hypothetical protein